MVRVHIVWAETKPGFPLSHSVKNNNLQISLLCSVNAAKIERCVLIVQDIKCRLLSICHYDVCYLHL